MKSKGQDCCKQKFTKIVSVHIYLRKEFSRLSLKSAIGLRYEPCRHSRAGATARIGNQDQNDQRPILTHIVEYISPAETSQFLRYVSVCLSVCLSHTAHTSHSVRSVTP